MKILFEGQQLKTEKYIIKECYSVIYFTEKITQVPVSAPIHPLPIHIPKSNSTLIIDRHLSTKLGTGTIWVIAQRVALGRLWRKDQELIVRHGEAELLRDVVVVLRRFVSGAACAVEAAAGVNARGCDVAVVLAGNGVAGSALGGWPGVRVCAHNGGCG